MAEGEQQPVLENVITSEQPPAAEEQKIEQAPASDANQQSTEIKAEGSGKLENNSENQEKSKK